MRKLLALALSGTFLAGVGAATAASAAPTAAPTPTTCVYFSNPTVEYVWSHVCHF
jgi:hypothetical protein